MSIEVPNHPIFRTLPLSTIRSDACGHRLERISGACVLPERKRMYILIAESESLGMTDMELASETRNSVNAATSRRMDLLQAGLIEATGEFRPLFGDETAQVWVIAGTVKKGDEK